MNSFQVLSGSDVSGSCYLVEIDGVRILFDCGVQPNSAYTEHTEIPDPESIDLVFISHAHMDHMGAVAYVASVCKNARIYATATTADFIYYQLSSTVADFIEATTDDLKYHNELLCRLVMNRIQSVGFATRESYTNPSGVTCKFSFFRAGHTPGAAMIYVSVNGYRILYTGDFSARETPLTEGYDIQKISGVDTLIMCGLHANDPEYEIRANSMQDYYERKIKIALQKCPKVIIPALQLTKGPEILSMIDAMIINGVMEKMPVYLTDSLWQLSKAYERKSEIFRVPHYFKRLSDRPGDTDEFDREIVVGDKKQAKALFNRYEEVRTDFSLHADYNDIVRLVGEAKPKETFVVHIGNPAQSPQLMFDRRLVGKTDICYPEEKQIYQLQGRR